MSFIFESYYYCKKCGKKILESQKSIHELNCKIQIKNISKSLEIKIGNKNIFDYKSIESYNRKAIETFSCQFCKMEMNINKKEDHLKWHNLNDNQDGDILNIEDISSCINIQSNYAFNSNFNNYPYHNSIIANEIINNLEVNRINNIQQFFEELCIICLDNYNFGDFYIVLPCTHFYHKDCIKAWIRIKNRCPICFYELKA